VYASAIRTPGLLPNAQIVVDHFHLVKLGNDALTKVRRRVTWELRDHRGRKSIRSGPTGVGRCGRGNVCRRAASPECATPSSTRILVRRSCPRGSPKKNCAPCYPSTVRTRGDPHLTRHRLHRFLTWCIDSQIPELLTRAATIDTWWPEINAYIHTGITNARTEGHNRLVKQVKRVGCGIPQHRKLRPPDTIPLHRQTAGSNPDFKLARSKSKTTYEARRGGTERGAGES
jgi:hypothetical protein